MDIIQEVIEYVQNAIKSLQKIFLLEGKLYCVKDKMTLTMVDAKMNNVAIQTRYYIGRATPTEFNNLHIKRDIDANAVLLDAVYQKLFKLTLKGKRTLIWSLA